MNLWMVMTGYFIGGIIVVIAILSFKLSLILTEKIVERLFAKKHLEVWQKTGGRKQ